MSRRLPPWRIALPFVLFIALSGLWSAYWFWAVTHARDVVGHWRDSRRAAGQDIACDDERWGGYPFRIAVSCSRFALKLAGLGISARDVTVMAQAYDLRHIIALADGDITVTAQQNPPLTLRHERAMASLIIKGHDRFQLDAQATNLADAESLSITAAELHLLTGPTGTGTTSIELAASLDGVKIRKPWLGFPGMESAALQGTLTNAPWPIPADTARAVEAMAGHGTSANIGKLSIAASGMHVKASGTAVMKQDATVSGTFPARIVNLSLLLQNLVTAGIIPAQAHQAGDMILNLLGAGNPDGIKTEFTLDANRMRLGPIPLGTLPPLR